MDMLWSQYKALTQLLVDNGKLVVISSVLVIVSGYMISLMGVIPGQYRLETEICMPDLGCFSIYGEYTLRPFNVLPQHRSLVNTKFIVHHADHTNTVISHTNIEYLVSQLSADKSLILVIHGWISSRYDPTVKDLMEALVTAKSGELNIVFVEWERGSTQTYPQAVANTRVVGTEVARFLSLAQANIGLDKVHLVGISLGAHIAGTCGSLLPGIGRITALDAAGPLFEHYPVSIRLDPTDALFVDAIHTDGDDFYKVVMAEGGLGIHHSIGHADFYPNGGHTQPHCTGMVGRTLTDLTSGEFKNVQLKKLVACDHELSVDYFMHSLVASDSYIAYACEGDQQGFIEARCNSTNYMGYQASKPTRHTNYYLHMSHIHPFEGSHYVVNVAVQVKDLVCLKLILSGDTGVADQIEEHGLRKNCSAAAIQSAMLFSHQPINTLQELTVVWEDNAASHNQVLVHGLTQLSILNATVTHNGRRYFSCSQILLGFTQSVTLLLSETPCHQ